LAYSVVYKRSVSRDLRRISKTEVRRLLKHIEDDLPKKADNVPVLNGDFTGLRKFRIGDYRVIFAIRDEEIIILRIGHKKDVYKKASSMSLERTP